MKTILLHGPAITSSRKKLLEIKQKFDSGSAMVFEKGADFEEILANLQTVSMFDENRLVIVENPPEDFIPQFSILNSQFSIVFWFDHELKKLPEKKDIEIYFFPEAKEVSVFPFLDMLANKNPKAFLELNKLKESEFDAQYIITMIFYLLRSLIYIPKTSPEFVKRKVAKQRENFSEDTVKDMYKYIIETDFKIKKGLMEPDQAEFLLVNKFVN